MNIYQLVSMIIALLLYLPLARQILKGEVRQNLATWILWGAFDALSALSMFAQNGNWHLPAAYVAGCITIIICMLKARTFNWTRFESVMTLLVIICLIGWWQSGPRLANILSSVGMVIATLPQMKDAWKNPFDMPIVIYIGYVVVNIISVIGGAGWTIEDRLYPVTCSILTVLIVLFSCRKFWINWNMVRIPGFRSY